MRYQLISFALFIGLFTQCTHPNQPDSTVDTLKLTDTTAILDTSKQEPDNYERALAILPLRAASSLEGMKLFESTFDVDNPEENDLSLKTYLAFQDQLINSLNAQLSEDPALYKQQSTLLGDSSEYSPEAVEYLKTLRSQGLTIGQSEGTLYYESNPLVIQTYFLPTLTPASKEYLQQYTKEINQPFSEDAGLRISIDELADRVAFWDKFIENYPSNCFLQQAKERYKTYLITFLIGQDNTPAFRYDTNLLDAAYTKSYRYFAATYPTCKTTSKIKEYMNILEKNNFQKTNEVELFQKKLIDN